MLDKETLIRLYLQKGLSMQEIATASGCSIHKVQYWMGKHGIRSRSISDAIYRRHNPHGDPFQFVPPKSMADARLFGLGMGLYWGEGTKANNHEVRLGNSDPLLLRAFLAFLERFFSIQRGKLRCGIQIFTDTNPEEALRFWSSALGIPPKQFYKITVTPSRGNGTYRRKCRYGVLTLYYANKKLRDLLIGKLAALAQW